MKSARSAVCLVWWEVFGWEGEKFWCFAQLRFWVTAFWELNQKFDMIISDHYVVNIQFSMHVRDRTIHSLKQLSFVKIKIVCHKTLTFNWLFWIVLLIPVSYYVNRMILYYTACGVSIHLLYLDNTHHNTGSNNPLQNKTL